MMDCQSIMRNYSRYLLIVFNLIFALTGILIVSIGATVKAYYNEYQSFLDNKFVYSSDLLIVIGVIIFIIAFFGCCGAIKENSCMTTTFSSLLVVVFILEILVGIGGVLLKGRTTEIVENALFDTMKEYGEPNFNETTALWDQVQQRFHCCGVDTYYDWFNHTNTTKNTLPVSCCKIETGTLGNFTCDVNSNSLYKQGCLQIFSEYIKGHAATVEGVGLGLAIIQLLGILLACYLSKQIRSDYETV
ncbi:23 kDa integral membrane protein [Aethina tumida]|uniref:23 kDa integral membrane protein n=1 Tax=Aethina tumida TaxID=116153 RepID=UPI00096B6004|nr:23 kDa integral membrane protein [Aethina tumida]